MGKEAELEKRLGEYARRRGCLYYKFSSPGNRGVPDRQIIAPNGRILFLELKAPGNKPTALQQREIRRLREHNQNATWTDSLDHGKALIDGLVEAPPINEV